MKSAARFAVAVFCTLSVPVAFAHQERAATAEGHVISGRVVDPHQLRPEDAVLMLGHEDGGGSFASVPVSVAPDGSFVTRRLSPDTYVLQVVRTPHSATKAATVVGFTIVSVETADVVGVTVAVRRDTAITGTFRMETDNRQAQWPSHIVVNAFLAFDGAPLLDGTVADGAAGGKFVLRNAFGPRVLRCSYILASGHRWWPSRVILNGADITNVPTDFSAHGKGQLEVVFTQHPARIAGTVTDAQGRPVRTPWIVVMSADRALWQQWATTSDVTQGDTRGGFSLPVLPGRYLVRAVPLATFHSWVPARKQIQRYASGGVAVEVGNREVKTVKLTVHEPSNRLSRE